MRRGPFPPPAPAVDIRELSTSDDGNGVTYLKIEPLNASMLVYETGDADPSASSSPVPMPAKFEAKGLKYKFLAYDPDEPTRVSVVKEWTAKLRLKHQLKNRGDHHEVELMALPKAGGIAIRYTTDGSAPSSTSAATYSGPFAVPENCRIVCAVAVASGISSQSEVVRIPIPQKGVEDPKLDPKIPARWTQRLKLDEPGQVWDFIQRLGSAPTITAYDINFTVENGDGTHHLEFTGATDGGYNSDAMKSLADRLQEVVGTGSLRLSVGSLGFPTGQHLLDWLKASNQPFDFSKVRQ